jgi:hypothetical protein
MVTHLTHYFISIYFNLSHDLKQGDPASTINQDRSNRTTTKLDHTPQLGDTLRPQDTRQRTQQLP